MLYFLFVLLARTICVLVLLPLLPLEIPVPSPVEVASVELRCSLDMATSFEAVVGRLCLLVLLLLYADSYMPKPDAVVDDGAICPLVIGT